MLTNIQQLNSSSTAWVGKNTASITSTYTDGIRISSMGLKAAVLLTPTASSNASLLYELSDDGKTFYTPYGVNNSNVGTLWNNSLTTSRYICFEPEAGEYIRFNFSYVGSNMSITGIFIQQEEIV